MSLRKNTSNKVIFGVCSGIANELKLDPTVVRAAFAILALLGFGLPILVYIVLALVMPS